MAANPPSYHQIRQEDDLSEKGEQRENLLLRTPYTRKQFLISHILLLGIYLLGLYFVWKREPSFNACDKKLSTYSPALPLLTNQAPKHLDAAIIQTNPYRGPPSPSIDAAWLRIGAGTPGIRLFHTDLKRLNKSMFINDPVQPLHRISQSYGGGYVGMLEVFHLLHCLNAIRKATWPAYYEEEWSGDNGGDKGRRMHTDHCIDMLREVIMCSSDVTPVTFYDDLAVPARKLPMPDFNTLHTCRDFEAILEWNNKNERTIQWDEIGLDLGNGEHSNR